LRYHFSQLETYLHQGEEVVIRRGKRVVAKLVPVRAQLECSRLPDFELRATKIFGTRVSPSRSPTLSPMTAVSDERLCGHFAWLNCPDQRDW